MNASEPERAAQACLQPNTIGENAGENAGEPERAAQACLQPNTIGETAGFDDSARSAEAP